MAGDLLARLRAATEENYREQDRRGHAITCPKVPANALSLKGKCLEVIGGHVCHLTDPHPSGYLHECWCRRFGEDLER